MIYKLIEYDISSIEDINLFNFANENIAMIIDTEKYFLIENGIKVILVKNETIIVEDSIQLHDNLYKSIPISNFYKCNKEGIILNEDIKREKNFKNYLSNSKLKFLKKYIEKNGWKIETIKPDWKNDCGLISLQCPHCKKDNTKAYMFSNTFIIKTHSKTDCIDTPHVNTYKKITKELRKLWKSQYDDYLDFGYYTNDIDKIKKTIFKFAKLKKDKYTGLIYYFDKTHYKLLDEKGLNDRNYLYELISKLFKWENFDNNSRIGLSIRHFKELSQKIKTYIYPEIKSFQSNNNIKYINCKNGIYDIQSNQLLEHDSDFFFTYCLNINFKKTNTDFIDKIIKSMNVDVNTIRKIITYCFINKNPEEKIFYFKGTPKGGNGKGVITCMIKQLLHNKVIGVSCEDLENGFFPDGIENASTLIDEDVTTNKFRNVYKKMNKLIDGSINYINRKNKSILQLKGIYTILLLANSSIKFKIDDEQGGYWRRIYFVNFNKTIENPDTSIKEKLRENEGIRSQLLMFLIEGLKEYFNKNDNELWFPRQKEIEIQEQKQSNPTIEFILNNYTYHKNNKIFWEDIWNNYSYYTHSENLISVSKKTLKDKFNTLFEADIKKIRIKDKTKQGYDCIKQLNLNESELPPKDNIIEFKNEKPEKKDL